MRLTESLKERRMNDGQIRKSRPTQEQLRAQIAAKQALPVCPDCGATMRKEEDTELFDVCPICKEKADKYRRIDVRDGVWFTCCPDCYTGIRMCMQRTRSNSKHPALRKRG